jgi:hypothetical protein
MPLILSVIPRGPKGVFVGKIEGTELRLIASKNPMLSAARSLMAVGVDPGTILTLRTAGSSVDRLSGRLDVIVRKVARKGKKPLKTSPTWPAPALPMRSQGEAGP